MLGRLLVTACLLTSAVGALAADATEPKRVLLLHSFGRDFSPWNEYARHIRSELDSQIPGPRVLSFD